MNDTRNLLDRLLDAGATFDWITPVAGAAQDIARDGRLFVRPAETWPVDKSRLRRAHIAFWGEQLHGANRVVTFSVGTKDVARMQDLLATDANGSGKWGAWLILFVFVALLALALAIGVTL